MTRARDARRARRGARDAIRESVGRSDRGETLRATTGRWDDARAVGRARGRRARGGAFGGR